MKLTGKIKLFCAGDSKGRGYGFIRPDDGGADVFLHIALCREHEINPRVGMRLIFEETVTPKGRKATWIGAPVGR